MDNASQTILRDLFFSSLSHPMGVDAVRFRIKHEDSIDLIEDLLRRSYFTQQDRTYQLRLITIIKLADTVDEAKAILRNGETIFSLLKDYYRKTPDEPVELATLSELSGLPRKDLNNAIRHMSDGMFLQSRSSDFPDGEKATVSASESVIRYRTYGDALAHTLEIHTRMEEAHKNYNPEALRQLRLNPLSESIPSDGFNDFQFLLHEKIVKSALGHFNDGNLRHAVLDSLLAVFGLIKDRTGLDEDGRVLVEKAFAPKNPILILSNLATESGRSDQAGFIEVLRGIYQGVRNPKSHSLDHDFTQLEAAQYLVLASLLISRIEKATLSSSIPEKVTK